jgi:hypothetical protein
MMVNKGKTWSEEIEKSSPRPGNCLIYRQTMILATIPHTLVWGGVSMLNGIIEKK